MPGIFLSYNQTERRSYLCDSFAGLPASRLKDDARTKWDHSPYLEISVDQVKNHFTMAGIIDPEIVFVQGFFTYTMKPLSDIIQVLSIIRLDGDMYCMRVQLMYYIIYMIN
jgi:hypothetical protein